MSDQNEFMQQLQGMMGKLQEQAQNMEARTAEISVEGQAGGGMVKVVANGRMELTAISIERDAIDPNDPEMLEDLILAAVNQALKAARDEVAGAMAGGLNLPFLGR